MNEKICPLNLRPSSSIYDGEFCQADHCAWFIPPVLSPSGAVIIEGRCAVQALGALPDLIQAVKTL